MMIVLLAEHASMNALLKQYQKGTSIKLILISALTVVRALMFAQPKLFIPHKYIISEYKRTYASVCPFIFY
jgi:hypothetical protein